MKNILILIIFTLSITSVVAVNVTYVNFKGNFSNGTILYSDNYFINNGTIIGYDVYPIRKNCIIETVNKIKRVCRIQTIYLNRTKIKCELIENQRNCFIVPYQVPKKVRVCENIQYQIKSTKCNKINITETQIKCQNPNGENTNQLRLENFMYSVNNGTNWSNLSYEPSINNNFTKLIKINQTALFKLEIPQTCFPVYNTSQAIKITDNS